MLEHAQRDLLMLRSGVSAMFAAHPCSRTAQSGHVMAKVLLSEFFISSALHRITLNNRFGRATPCSGGEGEGAASQRRDW